MMASRRSALPEPTRTSPWSVTLDGVDVPLTPHLGALIGIETVTGKTIYRLLLSANERAISIIDLASILRFLAGDDSPFDDIAPPPLLLGEYIVRPGARAAQEAIVRNGVVSVLIALMVPILAATQGKIDETGALKVETN